MYQTARSQRAFLGKNGKGKLSRGSRRQIIFNPDTLEIKEIRHTGIPFKKSGSTIKFMARHGIRPGTVIANGFKPPKGHALKLERMKIASGTSTLSRRERELVMA
jgi:hypothetical protein